MFLICRDIFWHYLHFSYIWILPLFSRNLFRVSFIFGIGNMLNMIFCFVFSLVLCFFPPLVLHVRLNSYCYSFATKFICMIWTTGPTLPHILFISLSVSLYHYFSNSKHTCTHTRTYTYKNIYKYSQTYMLPHTNILLQ